MTTAMNHLTNRLAVLRALCAGTLLALVLPALAAMPPATALQGKRVLLVTGDPAEPSDDSAVAAHLKRLGLVVTNAREADPAPAAGAAVDLVVITATVDDAVLRDKYRSVALPVLTWSPKTYANLGMTGRTEEVDFGLQNDDRYAYCVNPTHPIAQAAGLPAEIFNTTHFDHLPLTWGKPSAAAEVVVIIRGDPKKAGIFTYEKGASMVGNFPAPARRAGFYVSAQNFHELSQGHGPADDDPVQRSWFAGLKLFDATVRWALDAPAKPAASAAEVHAQLLQAARGKKALYVQRYDIPPASSVVADQNNVAYLKSVGFEVTVVDQMEPDTHAAGKDLVVIAATVGANRFATRYQKVPVPLIATEAIILPYLRMTGLIRRVDFFWDGDGHGADGVKNIEIVNPSEPWAAGLSAGVLPVYSLPGSIKWGTPLQSAKVVATMPNLPAKATIFGYEKGATMNLGFTAPARRAFFFMDNGMFDHMTEAGKALYDATLLWSLQKAE